jgi:asparagine N-glycosylation enzyme membrane subunit Stt3
MEVGKYYNKSADDSQEVKKEEEHKDNGSSINLGIKLDAILENKYLLIGVAIAIILLAIVLRMGMLQYQGLFEPDGFFYYSVIRATVNNHFIEPQYLGISGFPSHNFIGEAPGLPYLTVIFYYILGGLGLSLLTVMRWLPILFGVLYVILAYFLAKGLSKSRVLGLLAMFFVAVSSGNIARTAGTVYRGDSFITLFILLALVLMLMCFREKKRMRKYVYAVLAAFSLSLGIVVWNGGPFVTVIYMLALVLTIAYGFIISDTEILYSGVILTVALLLTNVLQRIYVALGAARSGLELAGNNFFVPYLPILLMSLLTYYLIKDRQKIRLATTTVGRIIILGVAAIAVVAVLFGIFGSSLANIASPIVPTVSSTGVTSSGVNSTVSASIGATTQELQPPSWSFLWSSFNLQILLAPIGVALFLIFAYLINRGERFIKRDHFNLSALGFLVISAYFIITAYLQASAIRYNALISLPIAIFAAFAVYAIGKLFYHSTIRKKAVGLAFIGVIAVFVIAIMYNLYGSLVLQYQTLVASTVILAIPLVGIIDYIIIYILLICALAYIIYSLAKGGHITLKYMIILFVIAIILFTIYITYFESYTAVQADGINPNFLSAMAWMRNNTPSNSTVLALWPDGSVVEGWANRTSYMDSVGGENGTRIYSFAQFLFSTSPDTGYLYGIDKPDYLIVRNFWYEELGGIAQEGLVQNDTAYGYVLLSTVNVTRNATAQFFEFQDQSPPFYKGEMIISQQPNGTQKFSAYLGVENSTRFALMRSLILLNTSNAAYSIVNSTKNDTINYTLMVSYAGSEINGAYILGPKLVSSNLFKFTFLCNSFTCPYNTSDVKLQAVYINSDTRIFEIDYLNGS